MKIILLRCAGVALLLLMLVVTGGLIMAAVELIAGGYYVQVNGSSRFNLLPVIVFASGLLVGIKPGTYLTNLSLVVMWLLIAVLFHWIFPEAFIHSWYCLPTCYLVGASCSFGIYIAYRLMLYPRGAKPLTEESATRFVDKLAKSKSFAVARMSGIIILTSIGVALLLGIIVGVWVLVRQ
jgi:hypothetical protein